MGKYKETKKREVFGPAFSEKWSIKLISLKHLIAPG